MFQTSSKRLNTSAYMLVSACDSSMDLLLFAAKLGGLETVSCKEYVPDFKQVFVHFCLHAGKWL